MDPALACLRSAIIATGRPPLVIGVGDVRDYTGKYSVTEGNAITQGGALMVYSALGKLAGAVVPAERFDPVIAERELGYMDRRQLGDGRVHEVAGPSGPGTVPWLPYFGGSIAASSFFIVGGITELNYNIRSGGIETGVTSVGPKARTFTQSVAIDLRIVDTRSLLVVRTVSLTKQFSGFEVGFNIFRFFGSSLFDINVGAKGQEPLQLGIRAALEEASMRLVASVARVDPNPCLSRRSWQQSDTVSALDRAAASAAIRDHAPRSAAVVAAFNGSAASVGPESRFNLSFEPGSTEIAGVAAPLFDRLAAGAASGSIEITLIARDSETSDPARRAALTDQRIAMLVTALGARGIPKSSIRLVWRPAASDPSIHRGNAGEQMLARLRIGR